MLGSRDLGHSTTCHLLDDTSLNAYMSCEASSKENLSIVSSMLVEWERNCLALYEQKCVCKCWFCSVCSKPYLLGRFPASNTCSLYKYESYLVYETGLSYITHD